MKKDYKSTLNLPKTNFGMKANLSQKEPQLLQLWEKMGLYQHIRISRRGRPNYTLHDGPPYPTGDLHIGTGMNKILKDFIIRFHNMNNRDAPFIPGWDCHGLPIEHKVMTESGEDAPKIPDSEIRRRCRQFAEMYVEANRRQFKSLGCLGDWQHPYLTIQPAYEAAVLKVFRRLVEKGYVYRQLKPIHWCFSCETALAEAELEYEDRPDVAIYVEFPLLSEIGHLFPPQKSQPASILIWTTTPWTLPGNLAAAVHPKHKYALVGCRLPGEKEERHTILAADAVDRLKSELDIPDCTVLGTVVGEKLTSLFYRHPWFDRECPVILADYVNLEEGTGCVHTAPGHGEEDYRSGQKYGLDVFSPIDRRGQFTAEVKDLAGQNVFQANKTIIERLKANGLLWSRQNITHPYPHCWRCQQPVIFRATQQWFISLEEHRLRKRSLEEIAKVRWIPGWGKGRIEGMVEQRPDWCISRQRKWGVPIPAFYCKGCGEALLDIGVIDNVISLFEERGANCWFELSSEDLLPPDSACRRCGGTSFRKENDIFDVWFESGSSHRAVVIDNPALRFPADLYLEGSDQHRGWFQLSLLLATATVDRAPFEAVLTHGFVVDEQGEKMSKSRGNFISVEDALKKFPADILRLWFSSTDYRRDINVSAELIQKISDSYRKIRNTFRHCFGNLFDYDPEDNRVPYEDMTEIDRWALQEIELLRESVTRAYNNFEFHRVYSHIHSFCVTQMSAFYLDVLKDRLYTFSPDCRERRSSQTALWEITVILAKLLAPILCFTTEEIWEHLRSRREFEESIHLSLWPKAHPQWNDENLKRNWEKLLEIRSQVLKCLENSRREEEIRNSLEARLIIEVSDKNWAAFLEEYQFLLPTLFIVSQVEIHQLSPQGKKAGGQPTEIDGIWLRVNRAQGAKCVRCWKYSPSVGKSTEHPEICRGCQENLARL